MTPPITTANCVQLARHPQFGEHRSSLDSIYQCRGAESTPNIRYNKFRCNSTRSSTYYAANAITTHGGASCGPLDKSIIDGGALFATRREIKSLTRGEERRIPLFLFSSPFGFFFLPFFSGRESDHPARVSQTSF